MIYVLLAALLVLFAICYLFSGKDFFAPSTVQILTFAGAVFMCICFMWSLNCPHDFQEGTVGMIMGAMAISAVIGIAGHRLFLKADIKPQTPESVNISPISNIWISFILSILLVTILWLLMEIKRIGGSSGNFFATMNRFRALYSYSTEEEGRLPWMLSQLLSLNRVFFVLCGFNILRFWSNLSTHQRFFNITILGLGCIVILLTGERTTVINNVTALMVMYHLLRVQQQSGYKQYPLKSLIKIISLILFIMIAFFLTKTLVGRTGRNNTMNPVDYISYYVGSGFIAFDKYLRQPPAPSNIFGKYTFRSVIMFLVNYGIVDIPRYIAHLEFRPVGAGFTNNVYSFLRIYHYDFGMVGTFVLHGIMILFMSLFYEYVKKKRGNIGILVFSMMYYSVVMSFFTERFFSQIISLNFIKMLVILLVFYELLVRKRIRLKFRRTTYVFQSVPNKAAPYTIDL